MSGELELTTDQIIAAAVEILRESGLDAISMRSVETRLGVTPPPVYARVGNKAALLDAVAERLLADLVPNQEPNETWQHYARRWTSSMRTRLTEAKDSRLIVQVKRPAYASASLPLFEAMCRDGLTEEQAQQGSRLLKWTTVGFVAMDYSPVTSRHSRPLRLAGGSPDAITEEEVDQLFTTQVDYIVAGIERDSGR